mgnify:CR=1 FL=1
MFALAVSPLQSRPTWLFPNQTTHSAGDCIVSCSADRTVQKAAPTQQPVAITILAFSCSADVPRLRTDLEPVEAGRFASSSGHVGMGAHQRTVPGRVTLDFPAINAGAGAPNVVRGGFNRGRRVGLGRSWLSHGVSGAVLGHCLRCRASEGFSGSCAGRVGVSG